MLTCVFLSSSHNSVYVFVLLVHLSWLGLRFIRSIFLAAQVGSLIALEAFVVRPSSLQRALLMQHCFDSDYEFYLRICEFFAKASWRRYLSAYVSAVICRTLSNHAAQRPRWSGLIGDMALFVKLP